MPAWAVTPLVKRKKIKTAMKVFMTDLFDEWFTKINVQGRGAQPDKVRGFGVGGV
jgi:hypothetical protein